MKQTSKIKMWKETEKGMVSLRTKMNGVRRRTGREDPKKEKICEEGDKRTKRHM